MEQELRVGRALQLLGRLTSEMCAGKVETEAEVGDRSVLVRFVASSTTDSKVLTGSEGVRIRALITVAILFFSKTGLRVEIDRIKCGKEKGEGFGKFRPRKDWPKAKVVGLLRDCAQACFGDCEVSEHEADNNRKEASELCVTVREIGEKEVRFGRAMDVLFKPIGRRNGRKLAVLLRGRNEKS